MHFIGNHQFALWLSAPPPIMGQQTVEHVQPGQDGVTQQRVGLWGTPFDAVVASHFATGAQAQTAALQYSGLQGSGPVAVVWNGVPYVQYGQMFLVSSFTLLQMRVMPRLLGPGYDFVGGTEVVSRFRMIPISINELA